MGGHLWKYFHRFHTPMVLGRSGLPLTPLSQSNRRASGVQVPSNKRASTVQQACKYRAISGYFWGEIPPYPVQTLLKRCIFGGVLGVEGMV